MSAPRTVAVTGVGCLGAFGIGLEALAAALAHGKALARVIDRGAGYHRRGAAELAAACPPLDLTPWLAPLAARRMSDLSQHAVAAARMALEHAGLGTVEGPRTAIVLATMFGPGAFTEQLARQILEKGGKAASPFLFTDCVANAAAGQVAIELGARGPNVTLCQREAGPLLAVAQGAAEVALDRADVCLAGAVDEMKPLIHAVLDRFRALARSSPGAPELPRPFDLGRNGVLAGEGASVLVLEPLERARARGARILARLAGSARAFDPTASRAGFGRGSAALAAALRACLARLPGPVEVVVSGASGARKGDLLEAEVLRAALPALPPVLVPKAVHGEWGGGTLAAAVLALQGTTWARPEGCLAADPRCGVVPYAGALAPRTALLTAIASGGAAAWLSLEAGP